jgi:CubicO group peptidase (beta-lactamase class C family)
MIWPGAHWECVQLRPDDARLAVEIQAAAATIGSFALFAAVQGRVVVQHGSVDRAVGMQSVRKALMNALIGRAAAEGKVNLSSTLGDLAIDDVDPLTDAEKRATVGDCMMGRSGVYHRAAYEPVGLDARRPGRGSHPPGSHWFYNNWDFNVLATVLLRAGVDVFEAFDEWFARPMQMQDFDPRACSYFTEPASVHPAYLFCMSARDLARFGQLYLCRGSWTHDRLLPEEWIARSLHPHSRAAGGYESYAEAFGFLWWVLRRDVLGGMSGYAGLGGSGHGVFILPEIDAVIVHRTDGEATVPSWPQVIPMLASVADLCKRVKYADRADPSPSGAR